MLLIPAEAFNLDSVLGTFFIRLYTASKLAISKELETIHSSSYYILMNKVGGETEKARENIGRKVLER